ncbi:MAG: hypothetical protein F6J92_08590 [Symploca sp. SIO1A3]|nr:hypothetical protein [Symploca sp. SIO1A3]
MASKDTDIKKNSVASPVYRFMGGAGIAAFVILYISSFSSVEVDLLRIVIGSLVVILSGLLSSILGNKFIDALMESLGSFGL